MTSKRDTASISEVDMGLSQGISSAVSGVRVGPPTRATVFRRADTFYVINTYEDEGFAELAEHAALNPGTLQIEDLDGNILWRPQ